MLCDRPTAAGTVAGDFGLLLRNSQPVLSVVGRRAALPPGLFPEAILVSPNAPSDAVMLLAPHRNTGRRSAPLLRVAPGFLRAPPVRGRPATLHSATLSLAPPSRAACWPELILARDGWYTPALARRAETVLHLLVSARVGGAWWAAHPRHATAGRAVVFAAGDPNATRLLLQQAVERHGASRTVLVTSRAGGMDANSRHLGIMILDGPLDPWPLIEAAGHVYAHGRSEAALLAGLLQTPVECLGPGPLSRTRDPARLAAACLLLGTRYVDPFTGRPASCEAFLEMAADWRRQRDGNASVACCVGISFWKRRRMAAMLGTARPPAFRKTAKAAVAVAARRGGGIAVWPSRAPAGLDRMAQAAGVQVARVEDGFVRSVGLGADFLPPLSLVLDRLGLYYDATGPSDLETLLADTSFDPALLRRAAALRHRMVLDGVTKYNLPPGRRIEVPSSGRVVLVPGQVADDRSVLLGGAGVRPGLDLLRRVRQRAPEAHILYKPHPDVDAGHRDGAVPDAEVLRLADQVVRGTSMAALLAVVDEVHTLTSLTGFEALLRDKPVTTYGQPFYAGWGLTTDLNPPLRRTRRLLLDELVAGTMILYPRYIDPVTLLACGPEIVLDRLQIPALHQASLLVLARRLQGRLFERARRLGGLLQTPTRRKEAVS